MKVIATVKMGLSEKHNPMKKITGDCPLSGQPCTDVTGAHHSMLVEGSDLISIRKRLEIDYHVTRLEVVEE